MAMRRAPRIWEQKLEKMIRSAGVAGLGAASSAVVTPGPTPGPDAGGSEPAPPPVVDPDPTTPRIPAAPSVFPDIGGLSILWTGLDTNGALFPTGTKVQVHVSTVSGFTPSSSTLRSLLNIGERTVVTGLTSGTTYYVRFVIVAPDGQIGATSAQTSAIAGFVLQSNIGTGTITADMVSFDATAIGGIQQFVGTTAPTITNAGQATQQPKNGSTWINTSNGSYNVLESGAWVTRPWGATGIAAGAITETKIANDAITTPKIAAGAITADEIAANTITGGKIAAGAISTLQLAAGAITADSAIIANAAIKTAMIGDAQITNAKVQSLSADKLTAGTIDASVITVTNLNATNITTGSLSGDRITGGIITGSTIRTSSGSTRAVLGDGASASLDYYYFGTLRGFITGYNAGLSIYGNPDVNILGNLDVDGGLSVDLDTVFMPGVYNNNTTGIDNVGITGAGRLRRISSSQAIKYDITALSGILAPEVDPDRVSDVATVNPSDVLNLAVTEFSVIDGGEPTERRVLGFIADDVAAKLPIAATYDAAGVPTGVLDTGILAALLAVVHDQQQAIADLIARVEALES